MAAFRFFWLRPCFTVTAVALGLFVALDCRFPEKTVGHDVALAVSGPDLGAGRAQAIAQEMKTLLAADRVVVSADAANGAMSYRFVASLQERSGAKVRNAAQALAASVKSTGYEASAQVTARTERVSGTVYAFASDRVIRISTDGKSAAQLEAEIRDRLAAAGVQDAQVSVQNDGEKQKIGIEVHHESQGEPAAGEEMPEIVLTKNGQDLDGAGVGQCQVRVKKVKDDAGAPKLVVDLTKDGNSTTMEVPNVDGMSDLALQTELQSQLDRAGVPVRVEVHDGRISADVPH
jgi:hypothetical protein